MINSKEWEKYESKLAGVVPKERFVKLEFPRVNNEIVEQLKNIEDVTPTVSDVLDRMGINGTVPNSVLKPVCNGKTIVGTALTIRYIREKNIPRQSIFDQAKAKLGDKDAYAVSQPGDIVVFDNGGNETISTLGGLSARYAINAELEGCIVDGGVRDAQEIRRLGLPVWSRGITPITGRFRVEAIEINGPIVCGGVQVNPGDLVVADDNGVCFIPYKNIDEVVGLVIDAVLAEERLVNVMSKECSMDEMRSIIPPEEW